MRDIPTKVTGNSLTADEFNDIPTELENAITSAGITLTALDLTQLPKAIAHYVGNSSFYTDTGVADAYVATPIGTNKAPPAYVDGMVVEFKIGNTSTGASTVNVDGLGVKNITGTASAGALAAGNFIKLRFNTGSGEFDILVNGAFDVSKFLRNDQNGILTGDLDVTGNFSSLGIDDNTTGERLQISDTNAKVGTSGAGFNITHSINDQSVTYSGGSAGNVGANLLMFGGAASNPNDLFFRSGVTTTIQYDDSASLWDFQANDITTTGDVTGTFKGVNSVTAWVNFDGTGTPTIRDDFNVSSLTDNAAGDFTINFTNALADANYSVSGTLEGGAAGNAANPLTISTSAAPTTAAVRVNTYIPGSLAFADNVRTMVHIIGGD
jgi:hypothetical protein